MKLYHYTSLLHLEAIQESGWFKTTESNCSLLKPHAGPDVVWLTTDGEVTPQSILDSGKMIGNGLIVGRHGLSPHKAQVRIALSVPKHLVQAWLPWAKNHGLKDDDRRILTSVGGAGTWRISTRSLPDTMISDVTVDSSVRVG